MRRSVKWCAAASLAVPLAAAPASAQPAHLQPMMGVGYVANAPQLMVGGTVWGLVPGLRGFGLYVDFKLDPSDETDRMNFVREWTPQDAAGFGDRHFSTENRWRSVNLALLRPLTREFSVYAGAGYSEWTRYREYVDPVGERGFAGFYWVEDRDGSGSTMNLLGGVFLRMGSRIRAQFGVESQPGGVTVGLSYTIPSR